MEGARVVARLLQPPADGGEIEEQYEFEVAYRQVTRSAFLLARHLGRRTDEAMDIVQDAALRAWRYRASRTGDFRPWFLAIVYRLSRSPVPDWVPLPRAWDRPGPDPLSSAMDPDLVAAMRELPTRQRAALWLRYCDDLSVGDVARIMGCSEPAAKQLLLRGRDSLRHRLNSRPKENLS
jgi:DNA-directed RNA polymerase specialized sigma24 family protein